MAPAMESRSVTRWPQKTASASSGKKPASDHPSWGVASGGSSLVPARLNLVLEHSLLAFGVRLVFRVLADHLEGVAELTG